VLPEIRFQFVNSVHYRLTNLGKLLQHMLGWFKKKKHLKKKIKMIILSTLKYDTSRSSEEVLLTFCS